MIIKGNSMASFGTRHEIEVSRMTPYEDDFSGSPITLATSEPGTPTFSLTVTSEMLPTATGKTDFINVPIIVLSGKNNAAATRSVYYRIKKNTETVIQTSFSVSTLYYFTFQTARSTFNDLQVGDVIEIYFWELNGEVDLRFIGYGFDTSRVRPGNTPEKDALLYIDCNPPSTSFSYPDFSIGASSIDTGTMMANIRPSDNLYGTDKHSSQYVNTLSNLFVGLYHNTLDSNYRGLLIVTAGDFTTDTSNQHTTLMVYNTACRMPLKYYYFDVNKGNFANGWR